LKKLNYSSCQCRSCDLRLGYPHYPTLEKMRQVLRKKRIVGPIMLGISEGVVSSFHFFSISIWIFWFFWPECDRCRLHWPAPDPALVCGVCSAAQLGAFQKALRQWVLWPKMILLPWHICVGGHAESVACPRVPVWRSRSRLWAPLGFAWFLFSAFGPSTFSLSRELSRGTCSPESSWGLDRWSPGGFWGQLWRRPPVSGMDDPLPSCWKVFSPWNLTRRLLITNVYN